MRTYSPGKNFGAAALGRAGVFRFAPPRGLLFFIASSVPNRDGVLVLPFLERSAGRREDPIFLPLLYRRRDIDAVVDFDEALRDPVHPARMLPIYDCGDYLHPSDLAYNAMGDAIDLAQFD
jgi:hypothetical protein